MRGADGDGEGTDASLGDEPDGLIGVNTVGQGSPERRRDGAERNVPTNRTPQLRFACGRGSITAGR